MGMFPGITWTRRHGVSGPRTRRVMREFAGALRTARAEHQGMPYVAKRGRTL